MDSYNKSAQSVMAQLGTTADGLSVEEAARRLAANGKNELTAERHEGLFVIFLRQFANVMIVILALAAILSGIFGDWLEAAIIAAVIILNNLIGAVQEAKAERAVAALKKLTAATATVRRGVEITVPAASVVVGDIVVLHAGDSIPCDLRLTECHSLKTDESALTGESVAAEKCTHTIAGTVPLGDRKNTVFMGTSAIYGRGVGVAVCCGMDTQIGKIANMLGSSKKEPTPLTRKINGVGKTISTVVIVICALIFGIKLLYNIRTGITSKIVMDGLLAAISLAVAAIPEGLTAVITLVMTMGVTRMSRRNAIVKKLPAIETLGSAEIICSDKTGTLTQNKMTVVRSFTLGNARDLASAVKCAVLCNDARLDTFGQKISGDPTETALLLYAHMSGLNCEEVQRKNPRVGEVPFDSARKLMSTACRHMQGEGTLYVKGAADELLSRSSFYLYNGRAVPIDATAKRLILGKNRQMAGDALRVLGFACKRFDGKSPTKADESGLVFLGLLGMTDPVRPEAREAVKRCFAAGITPIMITGDHLVTAVAVGRELGIIKREAEAISGRELDALADADIAKYRVFARVSPQNKVRIVDFWKKQGKVCAMTGDGVNDAPALKAAHIGIGMGVSGTDVTKNVADIVLADDNFATIVIAVEEGRKIFDNIKKTVRFLLSTNLCEVLTLVVAAFFNLNVLAPAQILWVNLVTDTVPALGLGVERASAGLMSRAPLDPAKSIFSGGAGGGIVYQSVLMLGLVLCAFFVGGSTNGIGMTMAFTTLSLVQIAHAFNIKSDESILNADIFKNKILSLGGLFSAAATVGLIYTPWLNTAFGLTPLPFAKLVLTLSLSLAIIPLVEIAKAIGFIYKNSAAAG